MEARMNCPRCDSKLEVIHVDSKNIQACKSCGGMWLHKDQLNHFLSDVDGDVEMCSIIDITHNTEKETIKCLECVNTDLRKVEFLEYSGIIIDHCDNCGSFWIDKDEINNMHNHIEKVKIGSKDVKEPMAFHLLKKISEIAYSIFSS
jgi:Zn-finger nucleic acid-binding protein